MRTSVRIWNASTGRELWQRTFEDAHSCFGSLYFDGFSPDGTKIIMKGCCDHPFRFWHANSGREFQLRGLGRMTISSADFSPDGKRIVTVSRDNNYNAVVQIWSADTGRELQRFAGRTDGVFRVAFSPDGSKVVICGDEGEPLRVWNLAATGARPVIGLGARPGLAEGAAPGARPTPLLDRLRPTR